MDIQKDILSKINLSDQQRQQLMGLGGNVGEIGKFLQEQNISIPSELQGILSNVAGATRNAGNKARATGQEATNAVGSMLKGALNSTDIDEKLIDGVKGFGRRQ